MLHLERLAEKAVLEHFRPLSSFWVDYQRESSMLVFAHYLFLCPSVAVVGPLQKLANQRPLSHPSVVGQEEVLLREEVMAS